MDPVAVHISYRSFLTSYALLFVLFLLFVCSNEIVKGYSGNYSSLLLALFLSLSMNETIKKYKGTQIKLHRFFSRACSELRYVMGLMDDVLFGKARKVTIKSMLLLYGTTISIWNDYDIIMWFLKLYLGVRIARIALFVLSKRKSTINFSSIVFVALTVAIPVILTIFLIPLLFKELSFTLVQIKFLIHKYNIPVGKMIEGRLKGFSEQLEPLKKIIPIEVSDNSKGIFESAEIFWQRIKSSSKKEISHLDIRALKGHLQNIYIWYQLQSENIQHLFVKLSPIILRNTSFVTSILTKLFVFLSTFVTLSFAEKDFLWYFEKFLETLDPDHTITNSIRTISRTIIIGGLMKVANNFVAILFIGWFFQLKVYCFPTILISLSSILHRQIFTALITIFFGSIAYFKTPVEGFFGLVIFYGMKRYIRKHIFVTTGISSQFPLQTVVLGLVKYGPIGAFIWPLINSIPWTIFDLLVTINSSRRNK